MRNVTVEELQVKINQLEAEIYRLRYPLRVSRVQKDFLLDQISEYRQTMHVREACKKAKVGLAAYYRWLKERLKIDDNY